MKEITLKDIPFMLGSDPELCIFDKHLDRIIPSNGLVLGTKDAPHRFKKGTVQLDGTSVEIGPDPGKTSAEFLANIRSVVADTRKMLDAHEKDRYELRCGQLVSYHDDDIKALSKTVFDVGCSPEYRIRRGMDNNLQLQVIPSSGTVSPKDVPIGGHLHLGFCKDASASDIAHLMDCRSVVSKVDQDLAVLDSFNQRRRMVQSNGHTAVRVKSYGVEYRKPSSMWLANADTCNWIFQIYKASIMRILSQDQKGVNEYWNAYDNVRTSSQRIAVKLRVLDDKYQGTLPLDF